MAIILDPNKSFVSLVTYYKEGAIRNKVLARPETGSKVLTTVWKRVTWKEQNEIFSQSCYSVEGAVEVNSLLYRELKLRKCLKKWDAKDEDGQDIPLNDETIENLDPTIAGALLKQFEETTEPSQKDLEGLEEAARRFYEGKKPLRGVLPQYIYEHLLAKHYGWSLSEIRSLDYYDFLAHLHLCIVADGKDKEFELSAHGFKKDKVSAEEILRKKAVGFTQ
jgi:hypothetical protein